MTTNETVSQTAWHSIVCDLRKNPHTTGFVSREDLLTWWRGFGATPDQIAHARRECNLPAPGSGKVSTKRKATP